MAKRTEITIETSRRLTVRTCGNQRPTWCAKCLAEVHVISLNEAAALLKVSSGSVCHSIEIGEVHCTEGPDGTLVCVDSLLSNSRSFGVPPLGGCVH